MNRRHLRPFGILALALLTSCGDSGSEPNHPFPPPTGTVAEALTVNLNSPPNYSHTVWPADFDSVTLSRVNNPIDNPVTDRGALLGRVLFYDPNLSINQQISCASCHHQATGFTDHHRFSPGFAGRNDTFRTMSLLNVRFYAPGFGFWDRRALTIEDVVTRPIQSPAEMGFDFTVGGIDSLLNRMRGLAYYNELFPWVYGDTAITEDRMKLALSQFVRSLDSYRTRFDSAWSADYDVSTGDKGLSQPFQLFTSQENRGKRLFVTLPASGGAGCASCHVPPSFALTGSSFNNGLDAVEDRRFKAPSLRSISVTAPYMHDGRFSNLGQVVNHYDHGIQDNPALDNRLRGPGGAPQRLHLSAADKAALVAFLGTLTDHSIATDPRFSNPFRQ